jgi:hypothetical protein
MSTKQTITSHLKSLNIKRPMTYHMALEIQVLAWERHKDVAGLNGIPTLPLLDLLRQYRYKQSLYIMHYYVTDVPRQLWSLEKSKKECHPPLTMH